MSSDRTGFRLSRRRFTFWVGLGLFNLAELLRAEELDDLAARSMRATETTNPLPSPAATNAVSLPEHWTAAENNVWRWFERENLIDGHWKPTGITLPVNRQTGAKWPEAKGYLDESLVPAAVRHSDQPEPPVADGDPLEADAGKASALRRSRHGRPPSRWLRSLNADELRIWLKTIDVPEAGVEGMTVWEHLTRDHSFEAKRIAGLGIDEQSKLHAAAHFGY